MSTTLREITIATEVTNWGLTEVASERLGTRKLNAATEEMASQEMKRAQHVSDSQTGIREKAHERMTEHREISTALDH